MYDQRVISGSKSVAAMLDITDVRRILTLAVKTARNTDVWKLC